MKSRRVAGSNGSHRVGPRIGGGLPAWLGRALPALGLCVFSTVAGAGEFDGTVGAPDGGGVIVGDYQPGQDQSVLVSDGGGEGVIQGEEFAAEPADGSLWSGYPYKPGIFNGMCGGILGPACPRWTGQADVLLLWQGNVPGTPLLTEQTDPFPVTLTGNQLANGLATGPRTAILFNLNQCSAFEANYFNAGNFNGNRAFAAAGDELAWAVGGYNSVANIISGTVSNSGRIQSLELNWRRNTGRSLTFLAGFRWIEWSDSLTIVDAYDDGTTGTDIYAVRTTNDLFGGQIGFDAVLLTLFDVIRFNGVAKAGVYGNANAGATTTVSSDRLPPATFNATGNSTGFFGEVGVNGTVRLTKHLFWRAGYNFFWLSGVATSIYQVDAVDMTVPDGKVNLDGSVFLQGVNTGIEAVW